MVTRLVHLILPPFPPVVTLTVHFPLTSQSYPFPYSYPYPLPSCNITILSSSSSNTANSERKARVLSSIVAAGVVRLSKVANAIVAGEKNDIGVEVVFCRGVSGGRMCFEGVIEVCVFDG